jgi:hypothetical protein
LRILANENVPGQMVRVLRDEGHDVVWVLTEAPGSLTAISSSGLSQTTE